MGAQTDYFIASYLFSQHYTEMLKVDVSHVLRCRYGYIRLPRVLEKSVVSGCAN